MHGGRVILKLTRNDFKVRAESGTPKNEKNDDIVVLGIRFLPKSESPVEAGFFFIHFLCSIPDSGNFHDHLLSILDVAAAGKSTEYPLYCPAKEPLKYSGYRAGDLQQDTSEESACTKLNAFSARLISRPPPLKRSSLRPFWRLTAAAN